MAPRRPATAGLVAPALTLSCLIRTGFAQRERDGAAWLDALHVRLARQVFNRSVVGHLGPGPGIAGSARPPRTHEFVSTISLGTPPQKLTCLVDTSVSGLWVMPASGCSGCAGRGRFEVNRSSTFSGMTSTEVRAPRYLGDDSNGPDVWGLPFEDLLGVGPMELPGQGLNLLTSAPSQAHTTKGVDWDSVCGLAWPREEEAAQLRAPSLALNMMRTGGHAVFTLAPGLGDRSYVVAGDVPQTIYKQGTLVWEELEVSNETRPFWVVPGQAQLGGERSHEARFLVDTGTSFIYVPPAVLYKDLDLGGAISSGCGLDPAAGNLLVCDCSVWDILKQAQIALTIDVAGRRFTLDAASLFEKVPASDGEDMCLSLLQPSQVRGASARSVELVENVAGGGRREHRGGSAAALVAEDHAGVRADAAENLWVLGGAFLERFVVVLDFENRRLGVAEPMSKAAAAMTDPELLWFGSSYKQLEDLDANGNVMCADTHSLSAPCGPCGPDWGDVVKCQALCNSNLDCNYIVHSTDGGCRLYSSCEGTVTTAPSDYSSRMHIYAKQTLPFKQLVIAPGTLCSPDQKILVAPTTRSFDRAACERLCSSHHSCNYFAHLSDGTCLVYKDCVQLVTAEGTDATTEIYWKVNPFVFDEEQARTANRVPVPGHGMPWWLLHGVRPTGEPKDSGSFVVHTFSEAQQELYGIDENGEVVDQARFDRELPGVRAGGVAAPAAPFAASDGVALLSGAPSAPPAAAGIEWLSGPGDEEAATTPGLADPVGGSPGPAPAWAADSGADSVAGRARGKEFAGGEGDAEDEAAWFAAREVAVVPPGAAARGLRQPAGAEEALLVQARSSPGEPGGSPRPRWMAVRHAVVSAVALGSALLLAVYLRRHRGARGHDVARESMLAQVPRVPDEEEPCAAE